MLPRCYRGLCGDDGWLNGYQFDVQLHDLLADNVKASFPVGVANSSYPNDSSACTNDKRFAQWCRSDQYTVDKDLGFFDVDDELKTAEVTSQPDEFSLDEGSTLLADLCATTVEIATEVVVGLGVFVQCARG